MHVGLLHLEARDDMAGHAGSTPESITETRVSACLHELRQPLNVIGLATGNLRAALCPALSREQADYLIAKLDRIDQQVARVAELADQLAEASNDALATIQSV